MNFCTQATIAELDRFRSILGRPTRTTAVLARLVRLFSRYLFPIAPDMQTPLTSYLPHKPTATLWLIRLRRSIDSVCSPTQRDFRTNADPAAMRAAPHHQLQTLKACISSVSRSIGKDTIDFQSSLMSSPARYTTAASSSALSSVPLGFSALCLA